METARTHSIIIASFMTGISNSFMVHQRQCVVEHRSTFSRVFLVIMTCMDEASTQASPSPLDSVGTRDRAFPIVTHAEPHMRSAVMAMPSENPASLDATGEGEGKVAVVHSDAVRSENI